MYRKSAFVGLGSSKRGTQQGRATIAGTLLRLRADDVQHSGRFGRCDSCTAEDIMRAIWTLCGFHSNPPDEHRLRCFSLSNQASCVQFCRQLRAVFVIPPASLGRFSCAVPRRRGGDFPSEDHVGAWWRRGSAVLYNQWVDRSYSTLQKPVGIRDGGDSEFLFYPQGWVL